MFCNQEIFFVSCMTSIFNFSNLKMPSCCSHYQQTKRLLLPVWGMRVEKSSVWAAVFQVFWTIQGKTMAKPS